MSIDINDEILQDFIIEASEILESLSEQLVELEARPNDIDLLNSVFRGFHTIKGGAGFLNITPLVTVCHRAEDVFNLLRQGERSIDSDLMDAMLKVIDTVTSMLNDVKAGSKPEPIEEGLLQRLIIQVEPVNNAKLTNNQISENNTENVEQSKDIEQVEQCDDITDEEFELLLDQLHGKGKHTGAPVIVVNDSIQQSSPITHNGDANGEITLEEYNNLLDYINNHHYENIDNADKHQESVHAKNNEPEYVAHGNSAISKDGEAIAKPSINAVNAEDKSKKLTKESQQHQVETSVRVDTKRLDDIMNMVGELVLVRNRLATLKTNIHDEDVTLAVSNLDVVTTNLQNAVMKTRMQPIRKVFSRFPRVVRDLARTLNKEVVIELVGEETDLDKNIVEALADPLVHLVRNSVDHGIEMPDIRVAKGKPRVGNIVLTARQEGDHIQISIEDDGAGIDPELIKQKAIEKGIVAPDTAARMDNREIFSLIFLPGFSTKAQISDISGRGVGMDVVKTRISQLNGTVEINSVPGHGSRIDIKLPLTLAIMPTLMVMLSNQIFAFPLASVSEIFSYNNITTRSVDGKNVVVLRNKPIPLISLKRWLIGEAGEAIAHEGYVVIMRIGSQSIGCIVDQLIGQEEVVIKPLGSMLHGTKGVAGATITGNGKIALILDMPELMKKHTHSVQAVQ